MAKKRKRLKFEVLQGMQSGRVVDSVPAPSLYADEGTVLGREVAGRLEVHYEQAACPCGGVNDRCSRCDGTGFYAKTVVDTDLRRAPTSGTQRLIGAASESTFSNDSKGGSYGIRERGRFESNPLHDDYD